MPQNQNNKAQRPIEAKQGKQQQATLTYKATHIRKHQSQSSHNSYFWLQIFKYTNIKCHCSKPYYIIVQPASTTDIFGFKYSNTNIKCLCSKPYYIIVQSGSTCLETRVAALAMLWQALTALTPSVPISIAFLTVTYKYKKQNFKQNELSCKKKKKRVL